MSDVFVEVHPSAGHELGDITALLNVSHIVSMVPKGSSEFPDAQTYIVSSTDSEVLYVKDTVEEIMESGRRVWQS